MGFNRGETNLASHALHQLLADRQAQPGAAPASAVAAVGLGKLLENVRMEFPGNPGAVIDHADAHAVLPEFTKQVDLALRGREFDCIGQKIGQYLLETNVVDAHGTGQIIEHH